MPYFVFKINNHREYSCQGVYDAYRDARSIVRTQRRGESEVGVVDYRMVFASSEAEAEALLRTRRDRTPSEDD
jgi:hypothetical protein